MADWFKAERVTWFIHHFNFTLLVEMTIDSLLIKKQEMKMKIIGIVISLICVGFLFYFSFKYREPDEILSYSAAFIAIIILGIAGKNIKDVIVEMKKNKE